MRCGCKLIATNKTIKTANQSEFLHTKTHPRLSASVWSPTNAIEAATAAAVTQTHTRTKKNLSRRRSRSCLVLLQNLTYIMTLVTVFASALALPTPKVFTYPPSIQPTTPPIVTAATKAATTQNTVPHSRNTIDVSSGTVYTAAQTPSDGSRLRKRHSKRHSNWYDFINFNENITELEWVNPCGGFYVPSAMEGGRAMRRKSPKQILNMLKKAAGNEYKMLKAGQQDIDISNIEIWSLHNKTYKFLPKLKSNSTIALKRWYRNIQSYIASFAYLRRIQRAWDMSKLQRENKTSRELKFLLFSSRRILCEIETAINDTMPVPRTARGIRLPHVTRNQMNKRLKLYTKRRAERNPKVLQEANTIDLMWVKYYYYEFLETMWKVLRQKTKRRGQVALAQNPKAYNEVEKHFGSIAAAAGAEHETAVRTNADGSSKKRSKGRLAQLRRGNVGSNRGSASSRRRGTRGGDSGNKSRLAHTRDS
ncbi:uncharacterized protein LOC128857025 isoform X2 [Anastrepha ludens]|uniref:uncharacterized protein LOC128857025 isoform X2 n=1 Tax=Anastrepha ludens TaxID=28586 RepID=UPI0023AEB9DA|nr:uncharacterized protein LOC128857025 isoform X2 [Anastrepha ludens]